MVREPGPLTAKDYSALGELRYQIRYFLHFSEMAAHQEGLEPQQHQLLLAARALAQPGGPTIRQVADHLLIRHHSAVGLIDRLEQRGLVERVRSMADRREVRVRLTVAGEAVLRRLTVIHRAELRNSGPRLVDTLGRLLERAQAEEVPGAKEEDVCADPERHP
ncbi:MAG: MarR family transcriptional regulator [Acidobacteriota bacterium]|nr:MarR family transcriptional regulator [Acidobacteriota bacterium]